MQKQWQQQCQQRQAVGVLMTFTTAYDTSAHNIAYINMYIQTHTHIRYILVLVVAVAILQCGTEPF